MLVFGKTHLSLLGKLLLFSRRCPLLNGEFSKSLSKKINPQRGVSKSATLRLPFYLRTLRGLMEDNVFRISSTQLSKQMNLTASQIRQDLLSFGVSGLKGYGYDVKTLYTSIMDIAGVRDEYSAVILGTKEMITMLTSRPVFTRQGVALKKTFETSDISSLKDFESYCTKNTVDIVVLATESHFTKSALDIIKKINIKGVWNFSDRKLDLDIPVKNIWIDDSLMTLCFEISRKD